MLLHAIFLFNRYPDLKRALMIADQILCTFMCALLQLNIQNAATNLLYMLI